MKNYDLNQIDFTSTALVSEVFPSGLIQMSDTIEWYCNTGELAASVKVEKVIAWMYSKDIHDYEVESIIYLDEKWESVTQLFFADQFVRKELSYAA